MSGSNNYKTGLGKSCRKCRRYQGPEGYLGGSEVCLTCWPAEARVSDSEKFRREVAARAAAEAKIDEANERAFAEMRRDRAEFALPSAGNAYKVATHG